MPNAVTFEDHTEEFVAGIGRVVGRVTRERAEAILELAKQRTPVDTGALRDSLTLVEDVDESGGVSFEIGSDLDYAPAVHEGLSSSIVYVRAHSRRITQAFGKPITPTTVQVRGHTMRVAARAPTKFIESALREESGDLESSLEVTLGEEVGS